MATRLQLLQVKVSLQTIVKIGILFLTVSQKPLHEGRSELMNSSSESSV